MKMTKMPDTRTLEERCVYYPIARKQRMNEIYGMGLDKTSTLSYEEKGCYACDGYKDCRYNMRPGDIR